VFVREARRVQAIARPRPFSDVELAASSGKPQVSLLARAPSRREREKVLALAGEQDKLRFEAGELYWLPAAGLLDSPLDLGEIDRLLGESTRRSKGTIEQLASRHFAL
jgi:hypothetical protein